MSLPCDIVLDLIPLYTDGLASEATEKEVNEHLKNCQPCRMYYKEYAKSVKSQPQKPVLLTKTSDESLLYEALSRRMRKRHVISTATITAIVGLSVSVTLLCVIDQMNKHGKV